MGFKLVKKRVVINTKSIFNEKRKALADIYQCSNFPGLQFGVIRDSIVSCAEWVMIELSSGALIWEQTNKNQFLKKAFEVWKSDFEVLKDHINRQLEEPRLNEWFDFKN